ncbi:hypothetical protein CDD83_4787 [Cordyceps sp. RAO-2017]|nr:hypothetical protein CDD83_4787 [Cordyceps sp. RAO-2017]
MDLDFLNVDGEEQTTLDEWPKTPDGRDWDGTQLLTLVRRGESPFGGTWDVDSLVHEVEQSLGASIVDIPTVSFGANHYVFPRILSLNDFVKQMQATSKQLADQTLRQGFYIKLADRPDVVARLSRSDINSPGCHGSALTTTEPGKSLFELAAYDVLRLLGGALGRSPLYYRGPVPSRPGRGYTAFAPPSPPPSASPSPLPASSSLTPSILGRCLFIFEKAPGERCDYVRWRSLKAEQKVRICSATAKPCIPIPLTPSSPCLSYSGIEYFASLFHTDSSQSCLLGQAAGLAASLFRLRLPNDFASTWLLARVLTPGIGDLCAVAVAPTRDFCAALLSAKVKSTLLRLDRINSNAASATALSSTVHDSLMKLIPRVLPPASSGGDREAWLYRWVLDHGDFGIHNMTVALTGRGWPCITSVFDWEAGSIVPALLSEPKMVVTADLVIGDDGQPTVSRWGDGDDWSHMTEYRAWSHEYYKDLFADAPEYEAAIRAGRDARHIWFALRDMERGDAMAILAQLEVWAEAKLAELDARGVRE